MKHQKVDILAVRQQVSQEEKQRRLHYYTEVNRLGLDIPFGNIPDYSDYSPFKSKTEYNIAQNQALKYLINYKPVPKDLEEKLLEVKNNREKQSI